MAEFIGTYILVFCGTGAVVIDQITHGAVTHVGVSITFGLVVMSLIYALGEISGAHFNPAVSIAFAAAKRFPSKPIDSLHSSTDSWSHSRQRHIENFISGK